MTQTRESEVVLVDRADNVLVITLNRPRQLNAVNANVAEGVGAALEVLDSDPSLVVGIITGNGRAFSAGADLKALAAGQSLDDSKHPEWGFAGLTDHFISKPLIAAVNGLALGGGTEIVLACDLAILGDQAVLGLPEPQRGLFAGGGGAVRLPRQMPFKLAMEVVLTGEPLSPERALAAGLVNRVVPSDQVLAEALALAARIASNAPRSVRTSKMLVHRSMAYGSSWDREVWEVNSRELEALGASIDAVEGPRAFADKRPPKWSES